MTLQEQTRRDKPLSFHWRSLDPAWTVFLDLPPALSKGHERARSAIILDAVLEAVGRGRWISYSRRRTFYTGQRRYHGAAYTHPTVVRNVDLLTNTGLLEHEKASGGGPTGWQSRFRASPRLLLIPPPLVLCDPGELIRLKRDGRLVNYQDTAHTKKLRRNLHAINEGLDSAELDIDAGERDSNVIHFEKHVVYPAHRNLYRVFNDRGGRLYGPFWQNVKFKDRSAITIDGEPTVEEDYPEHHARLLYRVTGNRLEGPAYDIDGWHRDVVKVGFFITLNAKSKQAALWAVVGETGLDPAQAGQLIEDIKKRHRPVAQYFHNDWGAKLMNIDSGMAEQVLLDLLGKGIIALPIHDSFIVQKRHHGQLQDAMNTAFESAA